jgi:cell wall-associated NlpC family hydrolase
MSLSEPNILPTPPSDDPVADAVITHNVVPMRAEPTGGSEQVSQAILGENVLRLETAGEFVRVRTRDAYEGWVWQRHIRPFDPTLPGEQQTWPFGQQVGRACFITADLAPFWIIAGQPDTLHTRLPFGTWVQTVESVHSIHSHSIYSMDDWDGSINGRKSGEVLVQIPSGWREEEAGRVQAGYVRAGDLQAAEANRSPYAFDGQTACALARRFLGTPYLWGGTTPFGFDCSGLTQRVYAAMNIVLPRDAYMQADSPLGARLGADVPTQAGDLVFFRGQSDPRHRGITHVGMALDAGRFIHAVGKEGVVITPFADPYYQTQYVYCGAWRYQSFFP